MTNSKTERPRRTPINGTRNRLSVRGKEPGFVYRIVNDIDDRVQSFREMGYEIVTDNSVTVGDKRVADPTKEGTPIKISVGQGINAYVMKQKQEYFDDDQRAKQKQVDELEASMSRDAENAGLTGKLKVSREQERVPLS